MKKRMWNFGVVVLAAALIAGCGDGSDVVVEVDNDNNPNRTATPIFTPTSGPTPVRTATVVPTEIEATETPAPGATETPGGEATATPPPGATATPGGGPTKTATPTSAGQATMTPTPQATAAATCGDGTKDSGEQCDTGTTLNGASADCAGDHQCSCCLCRPTATHANSPTTSCTTCHGVFAPVLTFPTGSSSTFPASCH